MFTAPVRAAQKQHNKPVAVQPALLFSSEDEDEEDDDFDEDDEFLDRDAKELSGGMRHS